MRPDVTSLLRRMGRCVIRIWSSLPLSRGIDSVDEMRPSTPWFSFWGPRVQEKTAHWQRR